jgi:hypothetical protein
MCTNRPLGGGAQTLSGVVIKSNHLIKCQTINEDILPRRSYIFAHLVKSIYEDGQKITVSKKSITTYENGCRHACIQKKMLGPV